MLEYGNGLRRFRRRGWLLCLIWSLGLILGAGVSMYGGELGLQTVRQAAGAYVSFAGCLAAALMPLLLTAVLTVLCGSMGCWALCFARAFLLGLLAGMIGRCVAGGCHPAAGLLLVPAAASTPFLMLFWWRRLCFGTEDLLKEGMLLLPVQLLIASADYWMISPFLAEVINF